MPGASDQSNGERERYERIAATSKDLLALLLGGPPDSPLDLVVEMINALLEDASELESSVSWTRGDLRRDLFVLRVRQAAADPATSARLAGAAAQLTSIGEQVAAKHASLGRAIGDARQAFKELAAATDPLTRSALLDDITQAVASIRNCSAALDHLGHQRTAVSHLASSSPSGVAAPEVNVMPAPGARRVEGPRIVRTPRPSDLEAPPAATIRPPRVDDSPGGSFSPF